MTSFEIFGVALGLALLVGWGRSQAPAWGYFRGPRSLALPPEISEGGGRKREGTPSCGTCQIAGPLRA